MKKTLILISVSCLIYFSSFTSSESVVIPSFYSASTYTGTPLSYSRKDTIKVAILCGQSNMEGAHSMTYSPTYSGYQNGYIWYKSVDYTSNGAAFNYNQSENSSYYNADSLVGPDVSFLYHYNYLTNDKILVIKYSKGSSQLVDNGDYSSRGIWQVDANSTNANGLVHYRILMDYFIKPCVQNFKQRGIHLDFVTFFWNQGESDATNLTRATNYQPELIRLIDSVKWNLNNLGVLSPKFKPIITLLNNQLPVPRPYRTEVLTAQQNVVNYYNGYSIDANGYSYQVDNIHYDGSGQVQHGIDAATLLVDSILR